MRFCCGLHVGCSVCLSLGGLGGFLCRDGLLQLCVESYGARHLLESHEGLLQLRDALLDARDVSHINHTASLTFPFLI